MFGKKKSLPPGPPSPFWTHEWEFFLKGKFAYKWQKFLLKRKSGLYSDPTPKPFFFFYSNENFYNGQISSEKVLTLCSKNGKKKSGFFGSSVLPSGLIQAGLTNWPHQRLCHYWIAAYLPYIFFNFAWLIWWRMATYIKRQFSVSFSQSEFRQQTKQTT